ncbi:MAG: hypothetical protein WC208_10485 [Gallionella sp.]|jgi:hypothetical protein
MASKESVKIVEIACSPIDIVIGGRKLITVYLPDNYSKGGVNWSAIGTATVAETETFIEGLKLAVKKAKKLGIK